mmetsp:Transcript_90558/g.255662  ORF Transcript_90558/g.255662 Transcript_90558/m.255662 type:complete len:248 (+) Transcript_90558:428-1171(+)
MSSYRATLQNRSGDASAAGSSLRNSALSSSTSTTSSTFNCAGPSSPGNHLPGSRAICCTMSALLWPSWKGGRNNFHWPASLYTPIATERALLVRRRCRGIVQMALKESASPANCNKFSTATAPFSFLDNIARLLRWPPAEQMSSSNKHLSLATLLPSMYGDSKLYLTKSVLVHSTQADFDSIVQPMTSAHLGSPGTNVANVSVSSKSKTTSCTGSLDSELSPRRSKHRISNDSLQMPGCSTNCFNIS